MGFNFEVKLFALSRRSEGKGWGEIRRAIKERFNVDPPTVRSLQKWEKETDRGVLDHALKEKAKKEAEAIKRQALTSVAEDLLPRLWKARDAGDDIEYEGWRWFLSIVESTLGSEKFKRFLERYKTEGKGKPDVPPAAVVSTKDGS
ncbi:MAG: hypothetical protein Q8O43_05315 [Dehalococcoidia bacterium]|nr:hypothetical protein [Dehalococcoidia bacterium]